MSVTLPWKYAYFIIFIIQPWTFAFILNFQAQVRFLSYGLKVLYKRISFVILIITMNILLNAQNNKSTV